MNAKIKLLYQTSQSTFHRFALTTFYNNKNSTFKFFAHRPRGHAKTNPDMTSIRGQ